MDNRFVEMIQKGEELVNRINELLGRELDVATAGTVELATYLSELKAIHAESLEFTNPDIAGELAELRAGLTNEEYMEYLTKFMTVRTLIEGDLRDRLYDRTAKIDIAFNTKFNRYKEYNREITSINGDILAINRDIAKIDKALEVVRRSGSEEAVASLEGVKQGMLDKIAEKEAKIEEIKAEQKKLLHGISAVAPSVEPEVVPEHEIEAEDTPEEELPEELPPLSDDEEEEELSPLSDDEEEEELPEELPPLSDDEEEELVPVFTGISDGDGETPADEEPSDLEEEEEEEETLPPVVPPVGDDEEIEVVNHTDAPPTLLRRIGTIVYAVVTFLTSIVTAVGVGVGLADHFQNHHDEQPALESETQNDDELDEDDLETVPDETVPEETTPDTNLPEETVPEETTPEETKPEETKPEETVPEETTPEETTPEETIPENNVAPLPAEIAQGETIFDRETGVEVTHDGSAYLHQDEVTTELEDRDLIETDHDTTIVTEDDMVPDQKLPELTGDEQTYEDAVENMTDEEISELDAAIAEWAAEFDLSSLDSGLTLKP